MSFRDFYKRHGYVVIPSGVFPAPVSLEPFEKNVRSAARLAAKRVDVMAMFMELSLAAMTLGIGVPIFQTSPVCHAMGYDKDFEGVGPHQDWPALQSSLNAITAWIPMHPVTPDTYPLEVVPGSHLLGYLPAKVTEHYSEVDATGMEFVPINVPLGGALLFSVFTVHRTRVPGTGRRVAFSMRFEDAAEPTFRERGCPSAQRRVIERAVVWTPTPEQVRASFR